VLCCAALALAALARRSWGGAGLGMAVAAVYGWGVSLFFVSDRFRLPLFPFLCFGAGVWACVGKCPLQWVGRVVLNAPTHDDRLRPERRVEENSPYHLAGGNVRALVTVRGVGMLAVALTFSREYPKPRHRHQSVDISAGEM